MNDPIPNFDDKPGRATGPRTQEGKARSSMNALKDGFRSTKMIVPKGMEDEHAAFVARLTSAFQPHGDAEDYIFSLFLHDAWKLHRIDARLAEMAESGEDPISNPDCRVEYDRLERYRGRANSSLRANLRELRHLQTTRASQQLLPDPLGEGALPPLARVHDILGLAKRTRRDFPALAINTLAERSHRLREASEPRPPAAPISFRDFLTPEEQGKL